MTLSHYKILALLKASLEEDPEAQGMTTEDIILGLDRDLQDPSVRRALKALARQERVEVTGSVKRIANEAGRPMHLYKITQMGREGLDELARRLTDGGL